MEFHILKAIVEPSGSFLPVFQRKIIKEYNVDW